MRDAKGERRRYQFPRISEGNRGGQRKQIDGKRNDKREAGGHYLTGAQADGKGKSIKGRNGLFSHRIVFSKQG